MNVVDMGPCLAEGSCKQNFEAPLLDVSFDGDHEYAGECDTIKVTDVKDSSGACVEQAIIRRLKGGHGTCHFCETTCTLRIVSSHALQQNRIQWSNELDAKLKNLFL